MHAILQFDFRTEWYTAILPVSMHKTHHACLGPLHISFAVAPRGICCHSSPLS